jgi:hypothetical protein
MEFQDEDELTYNAGPRGDQGQGPDPNWTLGSTTTRGEDADQRGGEYEEQLEETEQLEENYTNDEYNADDSEIAGAEVGNDDRSGNEDSYASSLAPARHQQTAGQQQSFSDFQRALQLIGERAWEPAGLEGELKWQVIGGNGNHEGQAIFRHQVIAQRHLRVFAIMCPKTPYITFCHSIATYFCDPGDEDKGLHGKDIAFVGDRAQGREPQRIILPVEVWDWINPTVMVDARALEEFYDKEQNRTQFYPAPSAPPTKKGRKKTTIELEEKQEKTERVDIPVMLSLPTCMAAAVYNKSPGSKRYWTPAEMIDLIGECEDNYDMQIDKPLWTVMKNWCLAALQAGPGVTDNSLLAIAMGAITHEDESFLRWCEHRLNTTLGVGPSQSQQRMQSLPTQTGAPAAQTRAPILRTAQPHTQSNQPRPPPRPARNLRPLTSAVQSRSTSFPGPAVGVQSGGTDIAAEVGWGIALGFQSITNAGLMAQGAGLKGLGALADDKAKIYSPDSIAALKGFSNSRNIKDVQPIWATFQTTKNTDVHRRHLLFGMEKWARAHGVEIDRGIYFEQKSVEDIVNLRFNPGQGVARFKSAERGLSLLICRTRTPEEIERVRDREAAEQLTKATRILEEALKLQRGDPRAPASNYFELKLNITSFCALLHTLFGGQCAYYVALMRIRNCMDTPGVYNI